MIKVGITGVGFMGWIHYLAYQKSTGIEISAICTRNQQKLAGDWTSIQGNFGPPGEQVDVGSWNCHSQWESLLADENVDLVDICLPPDLHATKAIQALQAGKHVLIEKPMALSAQQCDEIVEAAALANRQVFVAHVLPFFPEYAFLREAVSSGEYGKLLGGHFNRVISDPTWLGDFWDAEKVGGPLIDLHVHDAHLIRVLFGMPKRLQCRARLRGDVVEYGNTHFEFADQDLVVTASSGVIGQQGRSFMHSYEVHFEKATMQFSFAALADEPEVSPLKIFDHSGQVLRPDLGDGDPVHSFENEMAEVVQSLEAGRESTLLGGALARDAIILCHRQTQSALAGMAMDV